MTAGRMSLLKNGPGRNPAFLVNSHRKHAHSHRGRNSAVTVVVLLTLMLGNGANTAMGGAAQGVTRRRTCDPGVGSRVALGARPRDVRLLVWREEVLPSGLGLPADLVGAFFLARCLGALVPRLVGRDPIVFTIVMISLYPVSAATCFVPTRRATRTDALTALRPG